MNKNRNSLFILLDRRGKLVDTMFKSKFDLTSISMKHLMESNQYGLALIQQDSLFHIHFS